MLAMFLAWQVSTLYYHDLHKYNFHLINLTPALPLSEPTWLPAVLQSHSWALLNVRLASWCPAASGWFEMSSLDDPTWQQLFLPLGLWGSQRGRGKKGLGEPRTSPTWGFTDAWEPIPPTDTIWPLLNIIKRLVLHVIVMTFLKFNNWNACNWIATQKRQRSQPIS